jgi:hypothetical protein
MEIVGVAKFWDRSGSFGSLEDLTGQSWFVHPRRSFESGGDFAGRAFLIPREIAYFQPGSSDRHTHEAKRIRTPDREVFSLDDYRESGVISRWNGRTGLVEREFSGALHLNVREIITEGTSSLKVGSWVRYAVMPDPNPEHRMWRCRLVEIYEVQAAEEVLTEEATAEIAPEAEVNQ